MRVYPFTFTVITHIFEMNLIFFPFHLVILLLINLSLFCWGQCFIDVSLWCCIFHPCLGIYACYFNCHPFNHKWQSQWSMKLAKCSAIILNHANTFSSFSQCLSNLHAIMNQYFEYFVLFILKFGNTIFYAISIHKDLPAC